MKREISKASLANLRPAKKGEVRNPKGITHICGKTLARNMLLRVDKFSADGLTEAETIFAKQIEHAKRGDLDAAMFCFHTAFGRPGQALDVSFTDKAEQIRALFPTDDELKQSLE